MSDYLKPTIYNKNSINHAWMGVIVGSHDLFCGCPTPVDHLKAILKKQECPHSTEKDTTVETTGITQKEDDIIDEGDLQRLFDESDDIEG